MTDYIYHIIGLIGALVFVIVIRKLRKYKSTRKLTALYYEYIEDNGYRGNEGINTITHYMVIAGIITFKEQQRLINALLLPAEENPSEITYHYPYISYNPYLRLSTVPYKNLFNQESKGDQEDKEDKEDKENKEQTNHQNEH